MAFKRPSFGKLASTAKKDFFGTTYKLSNKVKFQEDSDVYVLFLGLETGYYETMCHRINTHKVNGKTIGYGGSNYGVYVKCDGIDEDGNRTDSLCCQLAKKEKERIPDKNDSGKRIVSFATGRIHIPVLILGNTVGKKDVNSYPVSKVSILNELENEEGLKFAYLEFATFTFQKEIMSAYGTKLKDEGLLDYDLANDSEEFYEAVREQLVNTVVKIKGYKKPGFEAVLKEYSFFPFSNASIASQSGDNEREAIINYKKNNKIMEQVDQFLNLFNVEVDGLIRSYDEKTLTEYYNSAIGADLKAPIEGIKSSEKVEFVEEERELSSEEKDFLNSAINSAAKKEAPKTASKEAPWTTSKKVDEIASAELDDFSFDAEEEENFFEDDEN